MQIEVSELKFVHLKRKFEEATSQKSNRLFFHLAGSSSTVVLCGCPSFFARETLAA